MKRLVLPLFVLAAACLAQNPAASREVDGVYADAHSLYVDLHQNPELSGQEKETAAKLASRLRGLGYEVTDALAERVLLRC